MKLKFTNLVITTLIALGVSAQTLPLNESTGKVTFMEVVETDNVTANEAYDVLKKWTNGKPLKVEEDASGAKLFLAARHTVNYPAPRGSVTNEGYIDFKVQFFFKDGKFRYILTDFEHSGKYGNGGKMENVEPIDGYGKITERAWNMIRDQTYQKSTEMVESFKKALQEFQNDPARSDDW